MNKKFRLQASGFRLQASGGKLSFKACSVWPVACGLLVLFFCLGMAQRARLKVYIKKLKNMHYQLIVEGKPYIVKGVCYNPTPIGENYLYDFWSDPNEPWKLDGKLMKDAGINTVRFYQPGPEPEATRRVIRDLYQLYGVRSIMGHWLGFWEYPTPCYADKETQERIKKEVLQMVWDFKDEEGLLFWVLGNENNYSFSGKINPWTGPEIEAISDPYKQILERARIYYTFVNELAREIHAVDPHHPVALGNGELRYLDVANEVCPDIDLVACIVYRGKTFGNIFKSLRATFDRPIVFTEFGCDAYDAYKEREDEDIQAFFLESQWTQIYKNLAKNKEGEGNCLGGAIFEWSDEWWKHTEYNPQSWKVHDTGSHWSNGCYYFDIKAPGNMNMNEEWFGLVAISEELESGINKRIPRKSYYILKEFWRNPKRRIAEIKERSKGR